MRDNLIGFKPEQIADYIGKQTGTSEWIMVDQERINQFADVTEDHQFIHIDEEAAKKTPFGGTIAHGFLTLSLLSKFGEGTIIILDGIKHGVNYGFDKVRMMSPVRSGTRVRGHFTLMSAEEKVDNQWTFKYAIKVDIEGAEKPALVAEWITVQFL